MTLRTAAAGVVLLSLSAALIQASPITYTYAITNGEFSIDLRPDNWVIPDPVFAQAAGTFVVTYDSDDEQIGEGDTFQLGEALIYNTETATFSFVHQAGLARVDPGNVRILEFALDAPGTIGANHAASIDTNVYIDASVYAELPPFGSGTTTVETWAVDIEQFDVAFGIQNGVPLTVTLAGTFDLYIPAFIALGGEGLTQGAMVQALLIPEPAFSGLVAFCLAGAGVWIRRSL